MKKVTSIFLVAVLIVALAVPALAGNVDRHKPFSGIKLIAITEFGWVTFKFSGSYHEYYQIGNGTTTYVKRTISQITTSSRKNADVHAGISPQWVNHADVSGTRSFSMTSQPFWGDLNNFSQQYADNNESVTYYDHTTKVGKVCYSIFGPAVVLPYAEVFEIPLFRN